jgi:AhpD family alkylhydroperoxidase
MPRIAPAEGFQAKLLSAAARRQYGTAIVESTLVYARHPRLLRWFVAYNRAVEHTGQVPERLMNLAALKAATVVDCAFCIDIGSEFARRAGLTDAQLLSLHEAEDSGLFDDAELAVIAYARAMSVTPADVTDEQVETLRAAFGDKGVMELTHLIAWENARARTNSALGIGAGGFSTGRACARRAPEAVGAASA